MRPSLALLAALLAAGPVRADDYPKAVLRNELLSLTVYLPDAVKGFYRGTRFDWAGVVGHVEFDGKHRLFGPWKDTHDPTNHDDILGPVEEFGMEAPLGYAEAKEGETFLKIGVGELLKPKEPGYRFWNNYRIARPGAWDVSVRPTEVEFKQSIQSHSSYGYRYTKRIVLEPGRGGFRIEHELVNSGRKPIDTDHYNHNFFNVDDDIVGPDYAISFPTPVEVTNPKERFEELTALRRGVLTFTKPLDRGSIFATLDGLTGRKLTISLGHVKSGIQVSVEGDTRIEKMNVWGTRRAICPEPFIRIRLKPDESKSWSVRYSFTTTRP